MQISTYAQSLTMRTNVSNLQTQLTDLQRQLSTGLKSDSFAGLGSARNLVLALNDQVSQSNSYLDTINTTSLRIQSSSDALTRLDQISSEIKTGGATSAFDLTSGGQTTLQTTAGMRLSEIVDEVGGDGFLLMDPDLTRRYIAEITDGLVPELQRLGVVRTQYEHEQFRDNLMAF